MMRTNFFFTFLTPFLALIAAGTICMTGCYRMPTENDFSVVPTTNNPSVTCEKSGSLLPGVGY